jgi:hypothetical protein
MILLDCMLVVLVVLFYFAGEFYREYSTGVTIAR